MTEVKNVDAINAAQVVRQDLPAEGQKKFDALVQGAGAQVLEATYDGHPPEAGRKATEADIAQAAARVLLPFLNRGKTR